MSTNGLNRFLKKTQAKSYREWGRIKLDQRREWDPPWKRTWANTFFIISSITCPEKQSAQYNYLQTMQSVSTASQQTTTASWHKKTWTNCNNGLQNGNWNFILMCSAESWPRSPRLHVFHVGWEWTTETGQVIVWKRPGNFRRQHAEIWKPYHNYRQKGKSNGWSSVENLRIHRWRNVSGFVQNNDEIPHWIRRTSMVTPNLEACRGARKGTKTSDKENSFIGNIRIWRQTQEAKATNTCVPTPARRNDKYV